MSHRLHDTAARCKRIAGEIGASELFPSNAMELQIIAATIELFLQEYEMSREADAIQKLKTDLAAAVAANAAGEAAVKQLADLNASGRVKDDSDIAAESSVLDPPAAPAPPETPA